MSTPNVSLHFVDRKTNDSKMPLIVTDHVGTRLGASASYNRFKSKAAVNDFLKAQRLLAVHFGLSERFEEHVKNFDLVKEVSYVQTVEL